MLFKWQTNRLLLTSILLLVLQINVFATWSIIVLDKKTTTIGVAGASCTFEVSGIAKIITGKGVIIAQAYSDDGITNVGLALMRRGASPADILKALKDSASDREVPFRQYGIITFNDYDNAITFTGD